MQTVCCLLVVQTIDRPGSQARMQDGKKARRQPCKQDGSQASKKAARQARRQPGSQAARPARRQAGSQGWGVGPASNRAGELLTSHAPLPRKAKKNRDRASRLREVGETRKHVFYIKMCNKQLHLLIIVLSYVKKRVHTCCLNETCISGVPDGSSVMSSSSFRQSLLKSCRGWGRMSPKQGSSRVFSTRDSRSCGLLLPQQRER